METSNYALISYNCQKIIFKLVILLQKLINSINEFDCIPSTSICFETTTEARKKINYLACINSFPENIKWMKTHKVEYRKKDNELRCKNPFSRGKMELIKASLSTETIPL